MTAAADLRCSFCTATQREAKTLIAGPACFICPGCVQLCCEILVEGRANGTLEQLGEHVAILADVGARHIAAEQAAGEERARAHLLRDAITHIARACAAAVPSLRRTRCMWCEAELASDDEAREHVATCEKHPAVIKLAEATAPRRARRPR